VDGNLLSPFIMGQFHLHCAPSRCVRGRYEQLVGDIETTVTADVSGWGNFHIPRVADELVEKIPAGFGQ
jgi:hypothetical protein